MQGIYLKIKKNKVTLDRVLCLNIQVLQVWIPFPYEIPTQLI